MDCHYPSEWLQIPPNYWKQGDLSRQPTEVDWLLMKSKNERGYPRMDLGDALPCISRGTTRGERDVQRERDYKHKKGIR